MAVVTVVWKDGMHFCTHTKSGELMCDESSEVGKAYPSAPELLMASLGSCIGSVLVYYGEQHGLGLEGMAIELDWRIQEEPHRIGGIDISVTLPTGLSASRQKALERVAHSCLIHNTLTHPPEISLQLATGGRS